MHEELEVRIGKLTKAEYAVLARRRGQEKMCVWVLAEGASRPETWEEDHFLNSTEPKPDFFEVGKQYRNAPAVTYTVHHVHNMAHGKVAVAQSSTGEVALLDWVDWSSGKFKQVRHSGEPR